MWQRKAVFVAATILLHEQITLVGEFQYVAGDERCWKSQGYHSVVVVVVVAGNEQ